MTAESLIDRLEALPWALLVLIAIAVVGFVLVVTESPKLSVGEYIGALAAASGLHGIGHGIRMHAKAGVNH